MSTGLLVYTIIHVAISLVGIASGFVVIAGFLKGTSSKFWTNLFLTTTILTSVTGFGFPNLKLTPGVVLAILSLIVLAVTVYARSARHLAGRWNTAFIATSVIAQYFNVFVLVAQSFQKIPALKALAPTQSEPPFAIAQLAVLIAFGVLGVLSLRNARQTTVSAPMPSTLVDSHLTLPLKV